MRFIHVRPIPWADNPWEMQPELRAGRETMAEVGSDVQEECGKYAVGRASGMSGQNSIR